MIILQKYTRQARGLFLRNAGANAAVRPSETTLYDGGASGSFIGDASREITGYFGGTSGFPAIANDAGGAFKLSSTRNAGTTGTSLAGYSYINFAISNVVPTANEFRSTSISSWAYISF